MDWYEKRREEDYKNYKKDLDIAIGELTKMKFYPVDGRIICDLYAIPGTGAVSYYAIIYEKDGRYDMVYANPQFYDLIVHQYVKKYPFRDAKKFENHSAKDGKIILGIKYLPDEFVNVIKDIANNLSTVRYKDEGLTLDGCFQAIRFYKDDIVCSELIFRSEDILVLPEGKEYLSEVLYNLYMNVSALIEYT